MFKFVTCATRYLEANPLSSTTAEIVAEELLFVVTRVGFPSKILSDNAPRYVSGVMKEVARLMFMHQVKFSPYHAMTIGVVERFNGTLKKMQVRMFAERYRNLYRFVEPLLFPYRETPQESTRFCPFKLLYGRTVRGPMAILKDGQ